MKFRVELRNGELDPAGLNGEEAPAKTFGKIGVWHCAHESIFLLRVRSLMAARPAVFGAAGAREPGLFQLFDAGRNVQGRSPMPHGLKV